jgi:SAM-dependent methyltransferase
MDIYEEDFSSYLKIANEKPVLAQEIIALFERLKVKSVLDIGAGNGDLSSLIFKKVEKYTAVEPRKEFAKLLRAKGISVVEDTFPCDIGKEKYDLILCSHSVPYLQRDYEQFLKEAYEKLNKNGNILVITYIGERDDWNYFLSDINVKPFVNTLVNYTDRKNFLKQLGKVKEWFVFSRLESSSIEDLIKALGFVASAGEKDKKDAFLSKIKKIRDILETKYYNKESGKYFFPFKHVFLTVNKQ